MKISFSIIIILQIIILLLLNFGSNNKPNNSFEDHRVIAVKLETEELYPQAIIEYKKYVNNNISSSRKSSVYLKIADIYFEKILDYANALSNYYKALNYTTRSDIKEDINRKITECLDNLGRGVEARQNLEKTTVLDKKSYDRSHIVAKIGSKKISISEIDEEINSLPDELRSKYQKPEKKLEFLKQYIQNELLYEKGLKQNYDKNSDIIDALNKQKKNFIVQKVYNELIRSKIPPLTMENVKKYYENNKNKFKNKDKIIPFEKCQNDVAKTLQLEEIQKESSKFIQELFNENNIKIYDEMFRSSK